MGFNPWQSPWAIAVPQVTCPRGVAPPNLAIAVLVAGVSGVTRADAPPSWFSVKSPNSRYAASASFGVGSSRCRPSLRSRRESTMTSSSGSKLRVRGIKHGSTLCFVRSEMHRPDLGLDDLLGSRPRPASTGGMGHNRPFATHPQSCHHTGPRQIGRAHV